MNKRIVFAGVPLIFIVLAVACVAIGIINGISILSTISTILSSLSFLSTLVLLIVNMLAHERAMAKLYQEKQQRDMEYLGQIREIMGSVKQDMQS